MVHIKNPFREYSNRLHYVALFVKRCYNRPMKPYTEIKQEWKKRRQEIYQYYKKVGSIRLTAEHFGFTYPRAHIIIRKEEREAQES